MIFAKKELPLICYTVERCISCKNMAKRKFKNGDFLFQETTSCPS